MPVAAIDPYWINQLTYDAEELRRNQGFLLAAGLTPDVALGGVTDLRAMSVSLSSLTVLVGPGGAVVKGSKGPYVTGLSGAGGSPGNLQAADATNPRRDRVVLCIVDPDVNATGASRKAEVRLLTGDPRPLAASNGDGYPAIPNDVAAYLDLAYVDVPKAGNGSPVVTDIRVFTVAAGSPVPVKNQTARDALDKFDKMQVRRLDLGITQTWDATASSWGGPSMLTALAATGWTITGNVTVEQAGERKRVTVNLLFTRTGGNLSIGTGWTQINPSGTLPVAARGSAPVQYPAVAIVGGANNYSANVAIDPTTGIISIRGVNAFLFTTNAVFSANGVYFL